MDKRKSRLHHHLMKWIDLPPVWLALFIVFTWGLAQVQPDWAAPDSRLVSLAGTLLVGLGLALIIAAVIEMRRHRTTVIPHLQASTLVTSGIFARTRNPIYLGDALVLLGLALRWNVPLAVVLTPFFIGLITRRFIKGEEQRLQAKFPQAFAAYCDTTRRWM